MKLRLDPWRDLAVAAVLGFVVVMAAVHQHGGDRRSLDALAWVTIAVACGSMVVRRIWPLPVLAVTTAALLIYGVRDYHGGPIYLTGAVALYAYAVTVDRWRAAVTGTALGVVAFVTRSAVVGEVSAMTLLMFAWVAVAVLAAEAVRSAGERRRFAAEQREEETARRLAEDRLRIARDLHDSVAHAITAINVQAGVAAHVLERDPRAAAPALEAIRVASRDVLTELDAMLGVLRRGEEAPLTPVPELDDLQSLVASSARAGLHVDLHASADTAAVPAAVSTAAYRIVQEALTNVARHAGTDRVRVSVGVGDAGELTVEVVDDGVGAAVPSRNAGSGRGLAGIRERAANTGGTVQVGARPGGGYAVRASWPVLTESTR